MKRHQCKWLTQVESMVFAGKKYGEEYIGYGAGHLYIVAIKCLFHETAHPKVTMYMYKTGKTAAQTRHWRSAMFRTGIETH